MSYPFDSPHLRAALRTWTEAQPDTGGLTAFYHRLVGLLEQEDVDILTLLEQAHDQALREAPTLSESIEMAAYAASSYLEGYADALRDTKEG